MTKNPVDSFARSAAIINHGTLNEVETEVSFFIIPRIYTAKSVEII